MKQDDIIFYSICVYLLLGSIGIGVFEPNSQPWEVSGLIAGSGFLSVLIAPCIEMVKILNTRACEEVNRCRE